MISSSITPASTRSAAQSASSKKPVPGKIAVLGDGVVGQPGVALQRDPPGQGEALAAGVFDHRAQQRVIGVALADRRRIGCAGRRR